MRAGARSQESGARNQKKGTKRMHERHIEKLMEHLCRGIAVLEALAAARTNEMEWLRSHGRLATLQDLKEMEKRMAEDIDTVLRAIDTATSKLAQNIQVIADTDQIISDEIDKFLAGAPVGTVISDAQITALKTIAAAAQVTSDASDQQVTVLKAIAAKGANNPVPVPVPPVPAVPAIG